MMSICHLTTVHNSNDIRIFHKECSSLARNNFRTYLVACNCENQKINNVEIIGIPFISNNRFDRIFYCTKIILNKALSLDADIYHIHDPELLLIVGELKKNKKKVIYDAHEDLPRQILSKNWIPFYLRKFISLVCEFYENRKATKTDAIVTATPHIKNRFQKYNCKTIDINNFPTLDFITDPSEYNRSTNQICYIGDITKIRGISEVIDALGLTDTTLKLAGNITSKDYELELRNKPNWHKVQYLGMVNRDTIKEVLKSSTLGVVTLYPTQNYLDSLPIKMFEYMAAGLPVIASDFPLWRTIITENNCGLLVDPQNPEKIAEAINYLLNNRDIAEKMGQNGRKAIIEKYNWSNEEKKLIELYNSL